MESRAPWSAAGGVVAVVFLPNAVAWASAAAPAHSALPVWPVYVFGLLGLCGLYCLIASLVPLWPFGRVRSVPELLDDYIRHGHEARERLIQERLEPLDGAAVVAEWTLRTANGLRARFPAIVDEFVLAAGNDQAFSGQALQIQHVNAKLDVLTRARKGLGGT